MSEKLEKFERRPLTPEEKLALIPPTPVAKEHLGLGLESKEGQKLDPENYPARMQKLIKSGEIKKREGYMELGPLADVSVADLLEILKREFPGIPLEKIKLGSYEGIGVEVESEKT